MFSAIGFDLETAKLIEDAAELDGDDLGISCAATFGLNEVGGKEYTSPVRWHGKFDRGVYAERMSGEDVGDLIQYLVWEHYSGSMKVVTWNGLAFDFRVLHDEADTDADRYLCKALALSHIDLAFQMLCEKGFMCGLSAAAMGLGVGDKTEGMSGALAPEMWQETIEDQECVLQYVEQDARLTAQVARVLTIADDGLYWITKAGQPARYPWWPSFWLYDERRIIQPNVPDRKTMPTNREYIGVLERNVPRRLLTVEECLTLPLPDTGWMKEPMTREAVMSWLA